MVREVHRTAFLGMRVVCMTALARARLPDGAFSAWERGVVPRGVRFV